MHAGWCGGCNEMLVNNFFQQSITRLCWCMLCALRNWFVVGSRMQIFQCNIRFQTISFDDHKRISWCHTHTHSVKSIQRISFNTTRILSELCILQFTNSLILVAVQAILLNSFVSFCVVLWIWVLVDFSLYNICSAHKLQRFNICICFMCVSMFKWSPNVFQIVYLQNSPLFTVNDKNNEKCIEDLLFPWRGNRIIYMRKTIFRGDALSYSTILINYDLLQF